MAYGASGRLGRAVRSLYRSCQVSESARIKFELVCSRLGSEARLCIQLFHVFMDSMDNMVREAMEKFVGGVQMGMTMMQLLLFADDLLLVA